MSHSLSYVIVTYLNWSISIFVVQCKLKPPWKVLWHQRKLQLLWTKTLTSKQFCCFFLGGGVITCHVSFPGIPCAACDRKLIRAWNGPFWGFKSWGGFAPVAQNLFTGAVQEQFLRTVIVVFFAVNKGWFCCPWHLILQSTLIFLSEHFIVINLLKLTLANYNLVNIARYILLPVRDNLYFANIFKVIFQRI